MIHILHKSFSCFEGVTAAARIETRGTSWKQTDSIQDKSDIEIDSSSPMFKRFYTNREGQTLLEVSNFNYNKFECLWSCCSIIMMISSVFVFLWQICMSAYTLIVTKHTQLLATSTKGKIKSLGRGFQTNTRKLKNIVKNATSTFAFILTMHLPHCVAPWLAGVCRFGA